MNLYVRVRLALLLFGLGTLVFNIGEVVMGTVTWRAGLITIGECLLGILFIFGPEFFKRLFKIGFPVMLVYYYWLFLWLSVFVGTCLNMMNLISFWDKLLHVSSPMILTAVGYGVCCTILMITEKEVSHFSPWLFLLFGFAFAGVSGVIWEFWEWAWDTFAQMNLQRYMAHGELLVGQRALADTMGDLLMNTLGAVIMAGVSWWNWRKEPEYFARFEIAVLR